MVKALHVIISKINALSTVRRVVHTFQKVLKDEIATTNNSTTSRITRSHWMRSWSCFSGKEMKECEEKGRGREEQPQRPNTKRLI
jgi:hypothetical protein